MTNMPSFSPVDFDPFRAEKEIEKIAFTNESQREIWLSCILGGHDANLAYNECNSLELEGDFDQNAFEKAIANLVLRHEALRATISANGEMLIIYKDFPSIMDQQDISGLEASLQKEHLSSFLKRELKLSFDLQEGPLIKFYLHKLAASKYHFTIIRHHIIGDGWSTGVMLEDLSALYNAYSQGIEVLLAPPDQISEYAIEQANFRLTDEYRQTENYWLDLYKNDIPILNLPLDYPRPSMRSYKGQRNDYLLDEHLLEQIKRLSVNTGSSLVSTLITAFEVFLYHRTGQQDIVLGLPAAGQSATGKFTLVGHCVNLLPLKSHIDPGSTFIAHLKERKSQIYDAYDHQQLTFGELLKKLNLKRDRAQVPLVPVVFNVDMGMDEKVAFTNLNHRLISNAREHQTFEISLNVNSSKRGMTFEWAFNTQLFSSETIDRMMQEFELLLTTITANPETLISTVLSQPSPFPEIAQHTVNLPANKTIIDLFMEQVALVPGNIAVVYEHKHLTYAQLNEKADQIANYLSGNGIKEEDMVPICIQPCIEMLIGILGILKSGAAYVPIDPELPAQRIEYILAASNADFLITDVQNAEKLKKLTTKQCLVADDPESELWSVSPSTSKKKISQSALMYIIYTSGSTGNPKGVMVTHGAIVDYFYGLKVNLSLLFDCRSFALGSAISTDLGNTILYGSLLAGGSLHLFAKDRFNDPAYIHTYFESHHIDCLKIVPSHWKYLMNAQKCLFPEKLLMFGGEALPGEFIKEIKDSGAACEVVNHYGPTETTIGKLIHQVDKNRIYPVTVPIGKPFSNTSVYVFNKHLSFCPIGVPGELYIGGEGLAKGYLNQPELTEKSFIKNPFGDKQAPLLYKTGDLVQWLPDGNIQYLGRIDDQVKIRGNRIELGEIQNILQKHPDIKQCAIVVDNSNVNDPRLAAYLVTVAELERDNIVEYLRSQLPEYMVPRILIKIDEIPLTPNGKVNRKLLPKPDFSGIEKQAHQAPVTDEEKFIAEIWTESLGIKNISTSDDFFELGGHSLIAVKVMTTIEKRKGIRLPLATLFENSTIEKLAKKIVAPEEDKWKSLVPIKTTGTKPPLYIVHGLGMHVLTFHTLSGALDNDQPVYGLQPKGLNPKDNPLENLEAIAAGYIDEILENNPVGPYAIAGYSSGGLIAFEMARQLKRLNKEVIFLGLLDSYLGKDNFGDFVKNVKVGAITQYLIKYIGYAFIYFYRNPLYYLNYKKNFVLGTMYNTYKAIFPDKKISKEDPVYIIKQVQKVHNRAHRSYQYDKYDGNAYLFTANDIKTNYMLESDSNGWAPYVNKLTVIDLPLQHLQFFEPGYVKIFADAIQKALNESFNQKQQ